MKNAIENIVKFLVILIRFQQKSPDLERIRKPAFYILFPHILFFAKKT